VKLDGTDIFVDGNAGTVQFTAIRSGGAVSPHLTAPPDQRVSSAVAVSPVGAISVTAIAAEAAASVVGLVTKQVDVQQVEADAAPTLAAIAAISTEAAVGTVAASAAVASIMTTTMTATVMTTTTMTATAAFSAATGVEQGQDGTGGK
jgi:hypothetical protein